MDQRELAREVLRVLELQRIYFRTRTPAALAESKAAESKLKRQCEDIISPPPAPQPDLFGEPEYGGEG